MLFSLDQCLNFVHLLNISRFYRYPYLACIYQVGVNPRVTLKEQFWSMDFSKVGFYFRMYDLMKVMSNSWHWSQNVVIRRHQSWSTTCACNSQWSGTKTFSETWKVLKDNYVAVDISTFLTKSAQLICKYMFIF